jgi:hypothetical protein
MSYGTLGAYGRRRRGAAARRVVNVLIVVLTVAAAAGYAYRIGVSAAEAKTGQLRSTLARFQEDNLALRDRLADLSLQFQEARQRAATLAARYAEDVPVGEAASLMRQLIRQLDAGTDPRRLGFLIRAAAHSTSCETLPESRRFVVETPINNGPRSTVRFADNRINIWASGLSARTADGSPEAWFDPAEPVHVVFEALGGRRETRDGELPLAHRMVVDGREYRFALVAGNRSFIEVTGQACALPGSEQASG